MSVRLKRDDGGPAFPVPEIDKIGPNWQYNPKCDGMSVFDVYFGLMTAILGMNEKLLLGEYDGKANGPPARATPEQRTDWIIDQADFVADKMIEHRRKRRENDEG